jgi:anaerobic dimethyl sulfoxide reductase subunit A
MSEKKESTTSEKKLSRRSMLKWSGALATAAVAGAVASYGATELLKPPPPPPPSFKPPLSAEVAARVNDITKQLIDRHTDEEIKYTCCSGSQCWKYCAVKVRVKNGKITALEPEDSVNAGIAREDAYISRDDLLKLKVQSRGCPMHYAAINQVYDPRRVIYPMKRVGERGEGKFVRITMEEAYDTIATKLTETVEKFGPNSLWHDSYTCMNVSSFPLVSYFKGAVAGWGCHSGQGGGVPRNQISGGQDPSNVLNAKLILSFGNNNTQTTMGEQGYYLALAAEQGIPVINVEPRYTWTNEVTGAQWIPVRVGTDVALALAMANTLFKQNLYNKAFVDKWVEPTGFQKWRDYVLGNTAGPDGAIDRTPEWAEKICGVPAETIKELTSLCVKSAPQIVMLYGGAVHRQFFGENQIRAIRNLSSMLGAMGVSGSTPPIFGSSGSSWGPRPNADWKRPKAEYYAPTLLAAMKWHDAVLFREMVDKGEMTAEEMNGRVGTPSMNPPANLKMFMLENNPLSTTWGGSNSILAAKKAYFIVAFTQQTTRPTAMYADLLIPQNYVWFESRSPYMPYNQRDLFRQARGPSNFFIYLQKCVDPPGDVRPHDWVWLQVAKRLGIAEKYHPRLANVSWEKWDEAVEAVHKEAYEKWAALDEVKPLNPPTWEDFQKLPVWRAPVTEPWYSYKGQLDGDKSPFNTNSKKIEFYDEFLAQGPEYLATHDDPKGSGTGYGPGNLAPMAMWQTAPVGDHFYSGEVTKYPIATLSSHSYYREHSFRDDVLMLRDECYRHAIWLSVPDAKARGIKDGDLVRVYNDGGEMVMPAYVTSRMVPGVGDLFESTYYEPSGQKTDVMPDGIDRRGNCNLISRDIDLPYTIVDYYNCGGLVQVEKF